jgi:16S rRNA (cytosine967-C5)-methyltransferase
MEQKGKIVAWELHPHRKVLLDRTLSRLNIGIAETEARDASVRQAGFDDLFDAVLVDAPCSGLGVIGKPDVRYSKSPEAIGELTGIQRSILFTCADYVRPGGVLVYATCTISRRENEEMIEKFLEERGDFEPDMPEELLPEPLKGRTGRGMLQLFPHIDGTEGFFIARMRRKQGRGDTNAKPH